MSLYSTQSHHEFHRIKIFNPCIGLVPLLFINGKATKTLQENRVKVEFFGADVSSI
jgi:hypothetical protein